MVSEKASRYILGRKDNVIFVNFGGAKWDRNSAGGRKSEPEKKETSSTIRSKAIREAGKFLKDHEKAIYLEIRNAQHAYSRHLYLAGDPLGEQSTLKLTECFNGSDSDAVRRGKFDVLETWIKKKFEKEPQGPLILVRAAEDRDVYIIWK